MWSILSLVAQAAIAEAFKLGKLTDDFVLPQDFNVAPSTVPAHSPSDRETGDGELDDALGLVALFTKSPADF